jgi:hypothetical protein
MLHRNAVLTARWGVRFPLAHSVVFNGIFDRFLLAMSILGVSSLALRSITVYAPNAQVPGVGGSIPLSVMYKSLFTFDMCTTESSQPCVL